MGVKRIVLSVGVIIVLVAIVIASALSGRGGKVGTEVYLEAASRAEIARIIKASGQIDPRIKVNISAHVIGKIEKLFVKEGDEIRAGAPFLRLEQEAYLAARERASAQVEIVRSRLRQSEINLEDAAIRLRRARRLNEEAVSSREALDQVELAFKSDESAVDQAHEAVRQAVADLEKAQDDLKKTTIYAPLSGRVIALNAEEGEVVVSGTMNNAASVIGTIADLSEILVEVDVDENEIVYVAHGQPVTAIVDAVPDHPYDGRVVEIGSSGFQRPGQQDVVFFKVKVLLSEPDPRLRAGMSARAEIEVERHADALKIPIQAVVFRKGDERDQERDAKVVFVEREGKAEQTVVTTGISDAANIEIVAGLQAGEKVVTGPYRALRDLEDGAAIRLKEDSQDGKKSRGRSGSDEGGGDSDENG